MKTNVTKTLVAVACAIGLSATTANALATEPESASSLPKTTSSTIAGVLQPVDLYDVFSARRVLSDVIAANGRFGLSACSGESTMRDYAGAYADVTGAGFSVRGVGRGARFSITQNVAGLSNSERAVTTYHSLVKDERTCQHQPAGHWRYGKGHTLSFQGGKATWMRSFAGDHLKADGGVIVARRRDQVTIVSITPRLSAGQIRQLSMDAIANLSA